MIQAIKRLPIFLAIPFIACIIYVSKSLKPRAATSLSGQRRMLIFSNTKDYHPEYEKNGDKRASAAKSSTDTVEFGGNTVPKVTIRTTDNSTFFFDKPTTFKYVVDVGDNEGKEIDRNSLRVTMKYLPKVASDVPLNEFRESEDYSYGRNLIEVNDCKTCHQQMGNASIPTFMQISERFWDNKNAIAYLANKIITGGSGAWGQQVMSAHPQLSKEDATEIVKYVLSVSVEKPDMEIPQEGREVLNEHITEGNGGRYIFTAIYTDKGGGTGRDAIVLNYSKVEAERADVIHGMQKETTALSSINNGSYFVLKNIDLKDVPQLRYRYSSKADDAAIEVHTDAPNGPLISTATYKATGGWDKYKEVTAMVGDPGGKHHLYFVFRKNNARNRNLALLDWVKFEEGNEVKVIEEVKQSVRSKVLEKGSSLRKQHNHHKQNSEVRKKSGCVLIANWE